MSTYDLLAQELREQRALAIQVIERQNELAESLSQQLQDAREENQRKDAEIERLREVLDAMLSWALSNRGARYEFVTCRSDGDIHHPVLDAARAALKGPAHD